MKDKKHKQNLKTGAVLGKNIWGAWPQARMQKCGLGVETGVGSGEGVSPSPTGMGPGEGAVPPPQKNFGIFAFEMVHFDAFWSTFLTYLGVSTPVTPSEYGPAGPSSFERQQRLSEI